MQAAAVASTPVGGYSRAMPRTPHLIFLVMLSSCIETNDRAEPTTSPTDTTEPEDTTTSAPDTAHEDVPTGEPCLEQGQQRCTEDGKSIEVCDQGFWETTRCGDKRICLDFGGAQCFDKDQSCRDILYCFLLCNERADPSEAEACGALCYVRGDEKAQDDLLDMQSCMEESACTGISFEESLSCIRETCGNDVAVCFFEEAFGTKPCAPIFACQDECGVGDEACRRACGSTSSRQAQADYGVLELCLFFACAGTQDANCFEDRAGDTCQAFASQCVAPVISD